MASGSACPPGKCVCSSCGLEIVDKYLLKVGRGARRRGARRGRDRREARGPRSPRVPAGGRGLPPPRSPAAGSSCRRQARGEKPENPPRCRETLVRDASRFRSSGAAGLCPRQPRPVGGASGEAPAPTKAACPLWSLGPGPWGPSPRAPTRPAAESSRSAHVAGFPLEWASPWVRTTIKRPKGSFLDRFLVFTTSSSVYCYPRLFQSKSS